MILMVRPLLRYAEFKGRASRAEFWLFKLFQVIVYTGLLGLILMAMTGSTGAGMAWTYAGLIVVFALICLVPNLAVMVRRLHDSDKSAWWLLLYLPGLLAGLIDASGFIGLLNGGGLAALTAQMVVAAPLGSAGGLCNLVLYILMGLKGTAGPNRFGNDPKQPGSTAGAFDTVSATDDIDRKIARYQSQQAATAPVLVSHPAASPLRANDASPVEGFGKRRS